MQNKIAARKEGKQVGRLHLGSYRSNISHLFLYVCLFTQTQLERHFDLFKSRQFAFRLWRFCLLFTCERIHGVVLIMVPSFCRDIKRCEILHQDQSSPFHCISHPHGYRLTIGNVCVSNIGYAALKCTFRVVSKLVAFMSH